MLEQAPGPAVEITAEVGPWGGPTRAYRGARIETNSQGKVFGLFLEGHPMHGTSMGNWENMLPLIDAWFEGRPAPAPYRWPKKR